MWRVEEPVHNDLWVNARDSRAPLRRLAGRTSLRNALAAAEVSGESPETSTRVACAPHYSPLAPMTLPERVQADYEGMT